MALKEDGGPSPDASPPNEPPNAEPPPLEKPKLGVVGDVMVSFSSSSMTLEIAPELNCSFPPKGLAFVPNRPGNVLPDILDSDVSNWGGDMGEDNRNSTRCDSSRFPKKWAQNWRTSVGYDLRTS